MGILPTVPLIAPPYLGGWSRSMLIELADRRTERRGSKTLDLNSEFLMALQDLCMQRRWTWRRKFSVFQLVPGQWQYDLTAVAPNPTAITTVTASFTDGPTPVPISAVYNVAAITGLNVGRQLFITGVNSSVGTPANFFNGSGPITATGAGQVTVQLLSPGQNLGAVSYAGTGGTLVDSIQFFSSPNARDLQQFVKHGVKYYPNPGNPRQWGEITPVFERDLQTAAIYENTYYPAPNPPCQYFIMPGAFLVLCIKPMPDRAYPVSIDYWSCPNFSADSVGEQIPLVPSFMHHVLLKRLEAQIFRYTLGEGAAKYQAAQAEYSALVANYAMFDAMVPGEHMDYSGDDDYESPFGNSQNAVQSTT